MPVPFACPNWRTWCPAGEQVVPVTCPPPAPPRHQHHPPPPPPPPPTPPPPAPPRHQHHRKRQGIPSICLTSTHRPPKIPSMSLESGDSPSREGGGVPSGQRWRVLDDPVSIRALAHP